MSLINQALRKAQNQRTPTRTPTATDHASAPQPNYHQNSSTNKTGLMIGLIIGIAVLIGLVAGLTVIVLRKNPTPAAQQAVTPAPAASSALGQSALHAPIAAPAPTRPIEQNGPSVLNELRLAREAAETKVATEAAAAQKAAATAAAKPSQDIIKWLGQAKVSGVRISASGSKVILNNKAYSVGETVNFGLGLKVLIIQEKRLLFIDANGKKYMKQL